MAPSTVLRWGYRAGRPFLFRLSPERAHHITMRSLAAWASLTQRNPPVRPSVCRLFGVDFPSRVGLAAGMDKDGQALRAWPAVGFGFVEVGTVTAHPQPGNSPPRLFRLAADQALINRMGFNNAGSAALATRLARLGPLSVPLGISIGKSKITPVTHAVEDYLTSLRRVNQYADYIAINVSSPNTPGLRSLQDPQALRDLLDALVATAQELASARQSRSGAQQPVPLLVKVAPDLSDEAIVDVVRVCQGHGAAGVIATNTTAARPVLGSSTTVTGEAGGLSGPPLAPRSIAVVRLIRETAGPGFPIVGVGGITGPADAVRMRKAGADLIQVYTGLIYAGPTMVPALSAAIDGKVP
ncbi:MAG: quinone-dependent dihydroorotate dehydrogenase [Actinomycetota bacterium]